jgi:hypothetical protein
MTQATYYVWLWTDDQHQPKYVGYGAKRGDQYPWDRMWDDRGAPSPTLLPYPRAGVSPVSQWLATLSKPPLRDPTISDTPYTKIDAAKYAAQVRRGLGNVALLSNRTYVGTNSGGGKARAVVDPLGDLYISVRAAARSENVDVAAVVHWLKNSAKTGWRYFDDDYQAKRSAPLHCCSLCHSHEGRSKRDSNLIAGPPWASGAICKKCNRLLGKLDLAPDALRARAAQLYDDATSRRKAKILKDSRPGLPLWLGTVADLLEGNTNVSK